MYHINPNVFFLCFVFAMISIGIQLDLEANATVIRGAANVETYLEFVTPP